MAAATNKLSTSHTAMKCTWASTTRCGTVTITSNQLERRMEDAHRRPTAIPRGFGKLLIVTGTVADLLSVLSGSSTLNSCAIRAVKETHKSSCAPWLGRSSSFPSHCEARMAAQQALREATWWLSCALRYSSHWEAAKTMQPRE